MKRAKEGLSVQVLCTDSGIGSIPAMVSGASGCGADRHEGSAARSMGGATGGAALEQCEVWTERQRRPAAALYTDDTDTISISISLIGTNSTDTQRPEPESTVQDFCLSHLVSGKSQR